MINKCLARLIDDYTSESVFKLVNTSNNVIINANIYENKFIIIFLYEPIIAKPASNEDCKQLHG